jgi:GNAT superfamily N-acetyltransferase
MDGEAGDGLIIRTLAREDVERLVRMDQEIGGRSRRAWYERKVERALRDSDVVISLGAELDDLLVGALMGSVHFGEFGLPEPVAILDTMLVDRRFRGQGVGARMLDQLLKNLRGLRSPRLRTEVGWDELELIGFFKRAGFVAVPRLVLELDVESAPEIEPEES